MPLINRHREATITGQWTPMHPEPLAGMTIGSTHPIRLWGVRTHNLAGIDVEIPTGQMTVITGLSGSGKTSLAIDTLFAEGQRRYLEVFSAYTRKFLPQFDRPPIDGLANVPPAIAVNASSSARGTGIVAEAGGVLEYLRLAFVHASKLKCVKCGQSIEKSNPESIFEELLRQHAGQNAKITFSIELEDFSSIEELRTRLREQGYLRVTSAGNDIRTDGTPWSKDEVNLGDIRVVFDRFLIALESRGRAMESIASALQRGHGSIVIDTDSSTQTFHDHPRCQRCGRIHEPAEYADFVLTNSESSCSACGPGKAIAREACTACKGTGLRVEILAHEFIGDSFPNWLSLSVREARDRMREASESIPKVIGPSAVIFREIERRLDFLDDVGLSYLRLDRPTASLSTGEARRVALSAAFGTGLARALFVLDEPTAGLHPRDTSRLLQAMRRLRDADNTLVVVEHDLEVIASADLVIELGPGAGREGGRITFVGTPSELRQNTSTVTGPCFARAKSPRLPREPRGWMQLRGASANNLKGIDVSFPLGVVCGIAGVSGAGKTSLVLESLVPALTRRQENKNGEKLSRQELVGGTEIGEVIVVDDASLGRTSRGNPATYLKIFDDIREKLALTLDGKILGKSAADFSFNKPGGRCETCEGLGERTVDLQFLPPARLTCPDCGGKRYQSSILEIKYRGRNIADVLSLSTDEAIGFFRGETRIQQRLAMLKEVGLGYITLGQPLSTLSRGEAQRLRLASRLLTKSSSRTLFVFEEPTLGLHENDVLRLINAFHGLTNLGHSVLVIEHHLTMLTNLDYIVELGPGAGEDGGQVIFTGVPKGLLYAETPTGTALRGC